MFFHLVGQHWSAIPKGVHGSVFLLVSLVWAGRRPSGSISCSQFRGEQARFLAAVPPWSGPRIGCRGPKATMEADSSGGLSLAYRGARAGQIQLGDHNLAGLQAGPAAPGMGAGGPSPLQHQLAVPGILTQFLL